jgi:hypothetical protein
METQRKHGFFSALKGEVVRGLSLARMLLPRSRRPAAVEPALEKLGHYVPDPHVPHFGSLRPGGEVLAPLMEGADNMGDGEAVAEESGRRDGFGQWVRGHLSRNPSMVGDGDGGSWSFRRSDLRFLVGVMGAPLAPVTASSGEPLPHLSVKRAPIVRIVLLLAPRIESSSAPLRIRNLTPLVVLDRLSLQESSSAQYILQQYMAASGGTKLLRSVQNAYAMGKVRMVASEFETATRVVRNGGAAVEQVGFVLWQMSPDMWYVELAVGGNKVRAGCNGRLVWRHTPWLGAHAAKGTVRPLRRDLQVLVAPDLRTLLEMNSLSGDNILTRCCCCRDWTL